MIDVNAYPSPSIIHHLLMLHCLSMSVLFCRGSFSSREWHTAELARLPGAPWCHDNTCHPCSSKANQHPLTNPEEEAIVSTWRCKHQESAGCALEGPVNGWQCFNAISHTHPTCPNRAAQCWTCKALLYVFCAILQAMHAYLSFQSPALAEQRLPFSGHEG